MRIMICGSMTFADKIMALKAGLEKLGHTVSVPVDADTHSSDPSLIDDLDRDYEHCVENDVMRKCMNVLANNDAVLVANYPKNGVNGYIGTSTLMELGLAHYLNKKIFLLYPTPHYKEARWAHEVRIFKPTVLNGDINAIGRA